MKKFYKRIIASVTSVVTLSISVSSLCANAVYDQDTVMTSNHGLLTGYISASKSGSVKYVSGRSTVAIANPPYIGCEVNVVKYPSGGLIDNLPLDYADSYGKYLSGDSTHWHGYTGAISVFGAHEYRGTTSVGCYTSIINFS